MRRKKTLFILTISICMAFLYTLSVVGIHSIGLTSEGRVKAAFSKLLEKPGIRLSVNQPVDSFFGAFSQWNVPNIESIKDIGVIGTITIFPRERVFDYVVQICNGKDDTLLEFCGFSEDMRVYVYEERVLKQKIYVILEDLLKMEELDITSLFTSFNNMSKTTKKVGNGKYLMTAMLEDKPVVVELTVAVDSQIEEIKIRLEGAEEIVIKVESTEEKLKVYDVQGAKLFDLKNWTSNVGQ